MASEATKMLIDTRGKGSDASVCSGPCGPMGPLQILKKTIGLPDSQCAVVPVGL